MHICLSALLILSATACFNFLIDPYMIWNVMKIQGINSVKPLVASNERIHKMNIVQAPHRMVILGTSRSQSGFDLKHPVFSPESVNLAMAGQPYVETRLLFDSLNDRHTLASAIIGVDFFAANAHYKFPADFAAENFSAFRKYMLLVSFSNLKHSVLTVINQKSPPHTDLPQSGKHELFVRNERFFLADVYTPPPTCAFEFSSPDGKNIPLNELRAVLSRAHRERVDVKLLISPSHARQWETLAAAGLWDKWEEWKRRLVIMNEEEAQKAGQRPLPLWDFSGYHQISTESVPAEGNDKTVMRWYIDSSHYTVATGNLMLDRIFGLTVPERPIPDDFGVLLTGSNIEAHLANIRRSREHYQRTHAKDIAEIKSMAREVAMKKDCLGGRPLDRTK